jgi:tripartite-type tricarboxylate transporter receptor subunit TctC
MARIVATKLASVWGQEVVVQNQVGRGGTSAAAQVAKSAPDGYTLLVNSSAHAYSRSVVKDLPYDPLLDFIPIAPLTSQPYVLVAGKGAHVSTVGELIAAAKAQPGAFRFGSAGNGTGTHLGAEKFNTAAGIKAVHVPSTPAQAIADTISGSITYWFSPVSLAAPYIREGKLAGLGVTTKQRASALPEVPSIAESGLPGFDYAIWYGVWAPRNTPMDVIGKIARDVASTVEAPEVKAQFDKYGAEVIHMSPDEFSRYVRAESDFGAEIAKAAGIRP